MTCWREYSLWGHFHYREKWRPLRPQTSISLEPNLLLRKISLVFFSNITSAGSIDGQKICRQGKFLAPLAPFLWHCPCMLVLLPSSAHSCRCTSLSSVRHLVKFQQIMSPWISKSMSRCCFLSLAPEKVILSGHVPPQPHGQHVTGLEGCKTEENRLTLIRTD